MTITNKTIITVQGWTIKGSEVETRIAVQREGMTLGNTKLGEAANNSLKTGTNIFISSQDIKDEIRTQIDALKGELSETIKSAMEKAKPERINIFKRIFS